MYGTRPKTKVASAHLLVENAFQDNIQCGICMEVKELRMLPCQHNLCMDCLGRILRELHPFCSFCREPLLSTSPVSYPVSRLAANLQREVKKLGSDLAKYHLTGSEVCEMESCLRPVIDMFCTICLLFMCFKCSKKECIDGVKHKVVEYEEELVNNAKTKLDKWKKDKIREINFLNNQQMRVVGQFRTVSYLVTVDNFMSMAERLNDLVSNFLQVMCAIGDKNGELQQAKPDVALTDLETVRVVHQLPREEGSRLSFPTNTSTLPQFGKNLTRKPLSGREAKPSFLEAKTQKSFHSESPKDTCQSHGCKEDSLEQFCLDCLKCMCQKCSQQHLKEKPEHELEKFDAELIDRAKLKYRQWKSANFIEIIDKLKEKLVKEIRSFQKRATDLSPRNFLDVTERFNQSTKVYLETAKALAEKEQEMEKIEKKMADSEGSEYVRCVEELCAEDRIATNKNKNTLQTLMKFGAKNGSLSGNEKTLKVQYHPLQDTSDSEVENSSTQPARNLGRKRYSRAKPRHNFQSSSSHQSRDSHANKAELNSQQSLPSASVPGISSAQSTRFSTNQAAQAASPAPEPKAEEKSLFSKFFSFFTGRSPNSALSGTVVPEPFISPATLRRLQLEWMQSPTDQMAEPVVLVKEVQTILRTTPSIGQESVDTVMLKKCNDFLRHQSLSVYVTSRNYILTGLYDAFAVQGNMGDISRMVSFHQEQSGYYVVSIQQYKDYVFTLLVRDHDFKHEIRIFDSQYRTLAKWFFPHTARVCSMALSCDKVYLAIEGSDKLLVHKFVNNRIQQGYILSKFSTPSHLKAAPPHHIVICDTEADSVCLLDCRTDTIVWSSTFINGPVCSCVDSTGDVWIVSRTADCFRILDKATGQLKQNVSHSRLKKLTITKNKCDMFIGDNALWVAIGTSLPGLLRFQIQRQQAKT